MKLSVSNLRHNSRFFFSRSLLLILEYLKLAREPHYHWFRFNEGISQEPQAVPQGSEEDPSGVACEALLESQYNSDLQLSRL